MSETFAEVDPRSGEIIKSDIIMSSGRELGNQHPLVAVVATNTCIFTRVTS